MDKWCIKRVKCEWCENEYKQKGELKTQRKSVHRESSYSCDKCEKEYELNIFRVSVLKKTYDEVFYSTSQQSR